MNIMKKPISVPSESNVMLHKKLNFGATEAYKLLRTNLMFTMPTGDRKCRVIGVTSSQRGEGKSTTAINLSYTIAETGKRVLLIDADMRLPSVAKKLQIRANPGLSNILAEDLDSKEIIRVSDVLVNWCILTAGDIPPNPTEMLGSEQMKNLINELAERYDYIIIDLPPVNIVSDALVISSLLDGMIVVVREDYTKRRELSNCIRHLELSNVKVLGFVMNVTSETKSYYGKLKNKKYYKSLDKYYKQTGYTGPYTAPPAK